MAPPASVPPSADAALARMHATFSCANAVQGNGKLDHFGELSGQKGRFRGDLLLFAERPASVRMDVVSPFGVALATLTSDGSRFAIADLRNKALTQGPATACNIARFTNVAVPGFVLVDLLRGEAPVLKHVAGGATMAWDTGGFWVIDIASSREAHEEIRLAPRPDDWTKSWQEQRMRVLEVRVVQQGYLLYRAELGEHAPAPTAGPRIDPEHLEPPIPPSGPACDAEIPRRIEVQVESADVRFQYQQATWNPPLPPGVFDQMPAPGTIVQSVKCED
jgi:hypothetical protein